MHRFSANHCILQASPLVMREMVEDFDNPKLREKDLTESWLSLLPCCHSALKHKLQSSRSIHARYVHTNFVIRSSDVSSIVAASDLNIRARNLSISVSSSPPSMLEFSMTSYY